VTVAVIDRLTVRFDLASPLGGFLQAATQPIVPRHLLEGIPASQLSAPDSAFGRSPVGTGPYRLSKLTVGSAAFTPVAIVSTASEPPRIGESPTPPVDALRTDAPPLIPPHPTSVLSGIEFRVFESQEAAAEAYRAGYLDAVSGLVPALAGDLAEAPDSRLLRYRGATLMAVILNLRPTHPEFRDAAVRHALLAAIDRNALVAGPLGGFAIPAAAPIPQSSWAFDAEASPVVEHDPVAAALELQDAGWDAGAGGWALPGADRPLSVELLGSDATSNASAYELARAVAQDWTDLGLGVTHRAVGTAELGSRARAGDFDALLLPINVGLDPDLYPLLASTQTTTTGSNISGLQDPALDKLLAAARAPGGLEARRAAYSALQQQLANGTYLLPLAFRDVIVVASDRLSGPVQRLVGDPADRFWDVLTWRLAVDR
jgi:peptide/nickel transport system substrate-binding protein